MASRLELHEKLCDILGTRYVYFQPPESVKLQYPCIVYSRSNMRPMWADNSIYNMMKQYMVTVIDKDPDSVIPDHLQETIPFCRMERHYTSEGLNHDVFIIYH